MDFHTATWHISAKKRWSSFIFKVKVPWLYILQNFIDAFTHTITVAWIWPGIGKTFLGICSGNYSFVVLYIRGTAVNITGKYNSDDNMASLCACDLVDKSRAGFLPLALSTPLVPVLHAVHLPTFPDFAARLLVKSARFGGYRIKMWFRRLRLVLL